MRVLYSAVLSFIIFSITSCAQQIPVIDDYYGFYKLIKVRENGKILNIDTLAYIEINEELYTTAIDRNSDSVLSDDEVASVAFEFIVKDKTKPYLKINNGDVLVALEKEPHFDLLLRRIDNLGNESILYLKK